jgi:hypothetical protein
MTPKRVTIIPDIHGKITRAGKVSEPDIYFILEQWLGRHPEFKGRERDIRIVSGWLTTKDGLKTEIISASMIACPEIAGYDPAQDADLYEYFLAEERET